ncbi:hypothetical protein [Levilactobacillus bambusae]|uniref:DUF3784 domain-containing protein n=1 Tax=Levilactobacillus bambusae TaxID=2024736 RepID=A0A2V1MZN3_9LACO|nr:hypothetical protein [Levilactobacillus bambusae]PWF99549.1 hypothetical protein DCM90_08890 [Levilactobacillus bambusae]
MAITLLMLLYTGLAVGLGIYFLMHTHRAFLLFHPESNQTLSGVVKASGIALLVVGVLSLIATFFQNIFVISGALLAGVIVILCVQLTLLRFMPK